MATKADRGTKRTCQNADCATRFYDLNREPIACPSCGTGFMMTVSAPAVAAAAPKAVRPVADPEFAAGTMKPEDVPEGEEALADIETTDEAAVGEDDETFLEEEEEEPGDVSGIVGGGGEGDDET